MIIECNNCNKKFNVDSIYITENGRMLQCSGCNHKWFYKKEVAKKSKTTKSTEVSNHNVKNQINDKNLLKIKDEKNIETLNKSIKNHDLVKTVTIVDEIKKNHKTNLTKPNLKKSYNILALIIIFIISFLALIIFLDTFQSIIGKIVPNFEFVLYNLYETINDVTLFLIDLF